MIRFFYFFMAFMCKIKVDEAYVKSPLILLSDEKSTLIFDKDSINPSDTGG